jgi:hypothetical protein
VKRICRRPRSVAASEWGSFGQVRRTLGGQLVLAIEPRSVDLAFESVDTMLGYFEEHRGPLVVEENRGLVIGHEPVAM